MISKAEFDRLPIHAIGYQAGGAGEPGYEATVERVRAEGLSRGCLRGAPDRGPVLARTGADWERPGVRFLDDGDAYVLLDTPIRHRAGIDVSVGDRVPPDRIVAIFRARAGEPLYHAYRRAVSPSEPRPPEMDGPAPMGYDRGTVDERPAKQETKMKRTMGKTAILDAIAIARAAAVKEAEEFYPVIKSRGTFLCTADAHNDQCSPAPEAEALQWNFSLREIDLLIEKCLKDYPNVAEVYIAGSYDGANTVRDLIDQADYDPMVSSWKVTIATREAA